MPRDKALLDPMEGSIEQQISEPAAPLRNRFPSGLPLRDPLLDAEISTVPLSPGIDLSPGALTQPISEEQQAAFAQETPQQEKGDAPDDNPEKTPEDPQKGSEPEGLSGEGLIEFEETLKLLAESLEPDSDPAWDLAESDPVKHYKVYGLRDIENVLYNIEELKKQKITDPEIMQFLAAAAEVNPAAVLQSATDIEKLEGGIGFLKTLIKSHPGKYLDTLSENKELVNLAVDTIIAANKEEFSYHVAALLPGSQPPLTPGFGLTPGSSPFGPSLPSTVLSSELLQNLHSRDVPAAKITELARIMCTFHPSLEFEPGGDITVDEEKKTDAFLEDLKGLPFQKDLMHLTRVRIFRQFLIDNRMNEAPPEGLRESIALCRKHDPYLLADGAIGKILSKWLPAKELRELQLSVIADLSKGGDIRSHTLNDENLNLTEEQKTEFARTALTKSQYKLLTYADLEQFLTVKDRNELQATIEQEIKKLSTESPVLFCSFYPSLPELPVRDTALQNALTNIEKEIPSEQSENHAPSSLIRLGSVLCSLPFDKVKDQKQLGRIVTHAVEATPETAGRLLQMSMGTSFEADVLKSVVQPLKDDPLNLSIMYKELKLALAEKPEQMQRILYDTLEAHPDTAFYLLESTEEFKKQPAREEFLTRSLKLLASADLDSTPPPQLAEAFDQLMSAEKELRAIDQQAFEKAAHALLKGSVRDGVFFLLTKEVTSVPEHKEILASALLHYPNQAGESLIDLETVVPHAISMAELFMEQDVLLREAASITAGNAVVIDTFERCCGGEFGKVAAPALKKILEEQGFDLQFAGMRIAPAELVLLNSFRGKDTTPVRIGLSLEELLTIDGSAERFTTLLQLKLDAELATHRKEHHGWSAALRRAEESRIFSDKTAVVSFFAPNTTVYISEERAVAERFTRYREHGMEVVAVHAEYPNIWKHESRNLDFLPETSPATRNSILSSITESTTKAIQDNKETILIDYAGHGDLRGHCRLPNFEYLTGEDIAQALSQPYQGKTDDPRNGKPLCELIGIAVRAASCHGELQTDQLVDYFQKRNSDSSTTNDIAVKSLYVQTDSQEDALANASVGGEPDRDLTIYNPRLEFRTPSVFEYYMSTYHDYIDELKSSGHKIQPPLGSFPHAISFADRMAQTDSPQTGQNPNGRWYSTTRDINISW